MLIDGTCEDCPDWEKSQDDGKKCGPDTCTQNEKLLIDGTCEACPDYYRTKEGDGKECEEISCDDWEIVNKKGVCEKCLPYSKSAKYGTKTYKLKSEALPIRKHTYSKGKWDARLCEADVCATDT